MTLRTLAFAMALTYAGLCSNHAQSQLVWVQSEARILVEARKIGEREIFRGRVEISVEAPAIAQILEFSAGGDTWAVSADEEGYFEFVVGQKHAGKTWTVSLGPGSLLVAEPVTGLRALNPLKTSLHIRGSSLIVEGHYGGPPTFTGQLRIQGQPPVAFDLDPSGEFRLSVQPVWVSVSKDVYFEVVVGEESARHEARVVCEPELRVNLTEGVGVAGRAGCLPAGTEAIYVQGDPEPVNLNAYGEFRYRKGVLKHPFYWSEHHPEDANFSGWREATLGHRTNQASPMWGLLFFLPVVPWLWARRSRLTPGQPRFRLPTPTREQQGVDIQWTAVDALTRKPVKKVHIHRCEGDEGECWEVRADGYLSTPVALEHRGPVLLWTKRQEALAATLAPIGASASIRQLSRIPPGSWDRMAGLDPSRVRALLFGRGSTGKGDS